MDERFEEYLSDHTLEQRYETEDEFDKEAAAAYAQEMRELFNHRAEQVQERCERSSKKRITFIREDDDHIALGFPNGRSTRTFKFDSFFLNGGQLEDLLKCKFEEVNFLGNYNAICIYEDKIIEALLNPLNSEATQWLYHHFASDDDARNKPTRSVEVNGIYRDCDISITLTHSSSLLQALVITSPDEFSLSLRIEGIVISQHDIALRLLKKIANAVLFELDRKYGLAFALEEQLIPTSRINGKFETDVDLTFSRNEYDDVPLSLYLYARSAGRQPSLQYLAFYQSIEYYFPKYADEQAHFEIRSMLKDPQFDVARDTDIARLLNVARSRGRRDSEERTDLKSTIQRCIPENDLMKHIKSNEDMRTFLSKNKELSKCLIDPNSSKSDLSASIAERIYDIRCRIVHSKSDGVETQAVILPGSGLEKKLDYDIDLISYIAQKVLIASARTLT